MLGLTFEALSISETHVRDIALYGVWVLPPSVRMKEIQVEIQQLSQLFLTVQAAHTGMYDSNNQQNKKKESLLNI